MEATSLSKPLSKSQYTRGLQCGKSLWLYRNQRELQDPVTPEQQSTFDQGTTFGILAQRRFPGGTLINIGHLEPEAASAMTTEVIAKGGTTIYEAAVLFDNVLIRADVLMKRDGAWHLYEVKSSTEVKDEYLNDVAIQAYVLNGAGITLKSVNVVIVDNGYVRFGALDLHKLFKVIDVTDLIAPALAAVPECLAKMKGLDALTEAPPRQIGVHCSKPYDCSFQGHCWKHVPDYSVWNLAGARGDKKSKLWHDGVKTVDAIPITEKLSAYQEVQRAVAMNGRPYIDAAAIRSHLAQLVWPLYFLDFETVAPAVPAYDGTRPYQQLPFQASVHAQYGARGHEVKHYEFLADGTKDPRPELRKFLLDTITGNGTIIAYNKSFEGGCLKNLGEQFVPMEARLWDLMTPFQKAWYVKPEFRGSYSIKKTLPGCVPGMSYEGMEIADGTAAMRAYGEMMNPETPPERRAQLMASLKAYCGQDTLGMVKLLDHLFELVG